MQCIELGSGPAGIEGAMAPPDMREAWTGLRLPLSFYESGCGYSVNAMVAVEILRLRSPRAALWWEENAPATRVDHFFNFDEGVTQLMDGLPSILAPRGHDGVFTTVGQFFWRLVARARRQRFRAADTEQLRDLLELDAAQWTALEASALTRPIVLMLASVIAEECCMRMQDVGSEAALIEANEEGHAVLVAIYDIAMECGVDVSPAEIDRPLSLIDLEPQAEDAKGPRRIS